MRIVLDGRRVGNGSIASYFENRAYFKKSGLKKRTILHELYHHVVDAKGLGIPDMLKVLVSENRKIQKLGLAEHPDLVYSVAYQNGFMHALQRLATSRDSGACSCGPHMRDAIKSCDPAIKTASRKKHYERIAYLTGYQTGLMFYLSSPEERKKVRPYYMHGCNEDIMNLEQCVNLEKEVAASNRSAHEQAEKAVKGIRKDIFIDYPPLLCVL